MSRLLSTLGTTLGSILLFASASYATGDLSTSATCTDGSTISVEWWFYEYSPTACPQWVGYDVYRRSLSDCGAWTRINAQLIPRPAGSHNLQLTDVPPLHNVTYEYRVDFVDAGRNVVTCAGLCGLCYGRGRASVPGASAPITHGRLQDIGWAIQVTPCATSCYTSYIVDDAAMVEELRPYAQNGETLRFWGTEGCSGFEGCFLHVDHYEVAGCDVTPAHRLTWGRVKTVYR